MKHSVKVRFPQTGKCLNKNNNNSNDGGGGGSLFWAITSH